MDFLTQLRAQLEARIAERAAAKAELDTILAAPTAEGRDLNDAESASFAEARDKVTAADDDIDALNSRVAELDKIEARVHEVSAATPAAARGAAKIKSEARTYRPDAPHSFFADLYATTFRVGDVRGAEERQARHQNEWEVERRDIAVAAMAGAIPPQYLLDDFAAVARAGRPFLNSLNSQQLPPDGTSFIIPRGTTGSAGAMTAEAAGFNEQDMANTDLTSTVNLVSAQQDVSRTLFMRGGAVVDQIIFPDLIEAVALAGNVSAINGSGTAPQHRGVLQVAGISAVAYTDATPTVGEAWPKVSDAIQRINSLRFMPATAVYMHPRRWGWITSAIDTTGRPLFEFSTVAPNSVVGLGVAAEYGQVVGRLQGLPVITDASIPTNLGAGTNEDIIIIARTTDIRLWESDLMTFTFEQTLSTAPGQVRLAIGQFQLFVPGRYPTSIATIGGTGLVTPAF